MRTLAIDPGGKRVGLAMSDAGAQYATPFDVLQVGNLDQATSAILKIIYDEGVQRIIVGLPLNMDGTSGPAVKQYADWGKSIQAKSGIPVLFVDERLSSFAAEQVMIDRKRAGEKLTRGRKKQQLDAVAAAGFLQEFLDGNLAAIEMG